MTAGTECVSVAAEKPTTTVITEATSGEYCWK